jgi:hypothetical protein
MDEEMLNDSKDGGKIVYGTKGANKSLRKVNDDAVQE